MSRVQYDGRRLIPAPLVTVNKQYQRTEDGTMVGSTFRITIAGTLVAWKGSPNSSGAFHTSGGFPSDEIIGEDSRLGAMFRKQEAIRELFSRDGLSLEFQSEDGTQPMKCNPRIISINFAEGIWYETLPYSIECECDVLYINGAAVGEDSFGQYIQSASESWQIDTEDTYLNANGERTHRVTHTVSAVGKRFFDETGNLVSQAWGQAKNWVTSKLGLDTSFITTSNINGSLSTTGYNHVRSESTDELSGAYSVTETWILANDFAIEDFTVETTTSQDTGLTSVSINGTITGLENSSSKYENARSKFSTVSTVLITRAQTYSGVTLNVTPLSTSVGRNPVTGIITYNYTYDNRPSSLIPNTKSEVISVNDSFSTDLIAIIPVLGRAKGPVLQEINTSREKRRTLNVELVMDRSVYSSNSISALLGYRASIESSLSSIVSSVVPTSDLSADVAYLEENSSNWDIKNLRYTMTKTWVWE